jgi:regulator of RNase E activity RraA
MAKSRSPERIKGSSFEEFASVRRSSTLGYLVSKPKAQMMVGPAYTVKCRAGDNLLLHAALNYCQEGDVLVVSNEEDDTRALIGEVMMAYLKYTKKIAGIILDGPIRDIDEIGHWDFFELLHDFRIRHISLQINSLTNSHNFILLYYLFIF